MGYSCFQVNLLFSSVFGSVKEVLEVLEPYQPAIVSLLILGKAGWRISKQKPLNREISQLTTEIHRLNLLRKSIRLLSADQIAEIDKSIKKLCMDRKEKKRQARDAIFTFGQIPSLFFSHPGSNIYQSIHQIVGRGILIHDGANPVHSETRTIRSRVKSNANLAGGVISMAGTAASYCQMAGVISSDNPTGHLLCRLAIGVHVLEGALRGISLIKTCPSALFQKFPLKNFTAQHTEKKVAFPLGIPGRI